MLDFQQSDGIPARHAQPAKPAQPAEPPMTLRQAPELTVRERQVLDALYRLRRATVAELIAEIPGRPTYAAVRAALRTLKEKDQVLHRHQGPRYVYVPAVSPEKARSRAVDHLVRTFFDGSVEAAAVALLEMSDLELDDRQVKMLERRVRQAHEEGR
jgi:BlaI family penicillinase repressor